MVREGNSRKKRMMLVVEVSEGEHYMLKLMALAKGCSIRDIVRERFLEPLKEEARAVRLPAVRV